RLSHRRPDSPAFHGSVVQGGPDPSPSASVSAVLHQALPRSVRKGVDHARDRDLISTVEQLQEKQRIAAAEGDDADVFGYHYENQMLAVNLFHMRGGRVLDRREFFWEDLPEFVWARVSDPGVTGSFDSAQDKLRPADTQEFHPGEFFSALLKQLYLAQPYVPRNIYIPVDFEDREELEEALSEQLAGEGGRA